MNDFPYTNFHDLNLDWIIKEFKSLGGRVDEIERILADDTPIQELVDLFYAIAFGTDVHGDPLPDTSEFYHNNCEYFKGVAEQKALQAGTSATQAAASVTQCQTIQGACQAILDSIPEDYTQLTQEVNDLKSAITNTDLSFLVTIEGKYMNTSGEQNSSLLAHTDYIKIPESATKILATTKSYNAAGTNSYKIAPTIVYYDANKTAISAGSTGNTFVVTETQEFPIPDGAVYCIVNQPRYQTVNKRFIQFLTSPIVAHVGSDYPRTALSDSNLTRFLSKQYGIGMVSKPKTIYIHGGTYDIYSEYNTLGLLSGDPPSNPSTGYWDYNVMIPNNTHIIGLGNVNLVWEPTTSQISIGWSQTISPVNASGSLILENVNITCKNGRYCIHDDTLGKKEYFGSQKVYKNVRCYKKQNDTGYGFSSTIGLGFDARCNYIFENCSFYNEMSQNAFYGHTRAKDESDVAYGVDNSPKINITNCVIDSVSKTGVAVALRNVPNAIQRIYTNITNCYIRGWVYLRDESAATGNNDNAYDVTLLNCTKVRVQDLYGNNNDYPVKELNPIGDVADADA